MWRTLEYVLTAGGGDSRVRHDQGRGKKYSRVQKLPRVRGGSYTSALGNMKARPLEVDGSDLSIGSRTSVQGPAPQRGPISFYLSFCVPSLHVSSAMERGTSSVVAQW